MNRIFGRIELREFLLRMFSAAAGRNICGRAFENFQQSLLNAFAGNIACDRWIVVFAADLIDLVDINNALLCSFDVIPCGLQKTK